MKSWHDDVFFGIHYDLHAGPSDDALGGELTPEHLRERLKSVRPDWIQCDCKGHVGWTSWPTKVGSPAPHIVRDSLRIHRDVTRQLGIKLGMHYSGVWDGRAIALHPEWARIEVTGKADPAQTSRMSAYVDELMIPQMLELIDEYDVDGFWVDGECWASSPDWSDACRAEFTRRTGIDQIPHVPGEPHWEQWLQFHRDLFVEHVAKYANAVHAQKESCVVCSNWMYTVRMLGPVTAPVDYLSGDFDHAWGANRAAMEGRMLDGRRRTTDLSWDLMVWGFTKVGPFEKPPTWVFKPALHLKQEVAEVVALGGAVMIYDQPQRTGWLTGWHQDIMADVAQWCRDRKAACFQTTSASEAAVAYLLDSQIAASSTLPNADGFTTQLFDSGLSAQPAEGALHALLETHRSTDLLLDEDSIDTMNGYKLIVIPEPRRISVEFRSKLTDYVRQGGNVLIAGETASRELSEFVGCDPIGDPSASRLYLEVDSAAVPVSVGLWQAVAPHVGVEAWAYRLSQQEPDKDRTADIVATRRIEGLGQIVAVHAPIFTDYYQGHYPLLRDWIAGLIDRMNIDWKLTIAHGTTRRLEVVLRRNHGAIVVNLINRGAGETLSPTRVVIDELPPIDGIELTLAAPRRPESVQMTGEDAPIEWSWSDGVVAIRISRVNIHAAILIE